MLFPPTYENLRYSLGTVMRLLLGVPMHEGDFRKQGLYDGPPAARARLERVLKCGVHTYNIALGETDPDRLAYHLDMIEPELRGFAYEGAGMGLMTLDVLARLVKEPGVFEASKSPADGVLG